MTRVISLGYEPREAFIAFHMRRERWAALVCHRRAGKTVACVADLVDAALRCEKKNGRFAYIAPLYTQAKDVAWTYLKEMVAPIPGVQINESELRVDFPHNGARVRLYGADNADRMRGLYFDGVVLDEPADMRPSVWGQVIRPTLSDRQGWAAFIGTPKGHNEFYYTYERARKVPGWFVMMLRASTSGLLPQSELDDARSTMTAEQYEQEYECSFEAAILGAYFGKEMADALRDGRIGDVPYDPDLECYTAWDLGKGANMPVWIWQPTRHGPNCIDFVEGVHSDGVPQVLKKIEDLPYTIAAHYVPPDAKTTDIGSGRSRIEQIILHSPVRPRIVPDLKVDDRIAAARIILPITRFDKVRCADGIYALEQYKADFDEVLKTFRDHPLKNWASHPADAFQVVAGAYRMLKDKPVQTKTEPQGIMDMTFDQALATQPMNRKRI